MIYNTSDFLKGGKIISKYILLLYKQFCDSLGKKFNEVNVFEDNDFISWIINMQKVSKEYINFLSYIGVVNNQNILVEVNKGKYDSLFLNDILIVSQFAKTMNLNDSKLLICDNIPIIQSGSILYDSSNIDFFITHNPYNSYYLSDLDQVHLLGCNICFGMFGKIHDSDRLLKLRSLKQFAGSLDEQFKIYYDTNNDYYFGCIKSQRKVMKLVKTK